MINKVPRPHVFRSVRRDQWSAHTWQHQVNMIRASGSWRFDGRTKRWLPAFYMPRTDWRELLAVIVACVGFALLVWWPFR